MEVKKGTIIHKDYIGVELPVPVFGDFAKEVWQARDFNKKRSELEKEYRELLLHFGKEPSGKFPPPFKELEYIRDIGKIYFEQIYYIKVLELLKSEGVYYHLNILKELPKITYLFAIKEMLSNLNSESGLADRSLFIKIFLFHLLHLKEFQNIKDVYIFLDAIYNLKYHIKRLAPIDIYESAVELIKPTLQYFYNLYKKSKYDELDKALQDAFTDNLIFIISLAVLLFMENKTIEIGNIVLKADEQLDRIYRYESGAERLVIHFNPNKITVPIGDSSYKITDIRDPFYLALLLAKEQLLSIIRISADIYQRWNLISQQFLRSPLNLERLKFLYKFSGIEYIKQKEKQEIPKISNDEVAYCVFWIYISTENVGHLIKQNRLLSAFKGLDYAFNKTQTVLEDGFGIHWSVINDLDLTKRIKKIFAILPSDFLKEIEEYYISDLDDLEYMEASVPDSEDKGAIAPRLFYDSGNDGDDEGDEEDKTGTYIMGEPRIAGTSLKHLEEYMDTLITALEMLIKDKKDELEEEMRKQQNTLIFPDKLIDENISYLIGRLFNKKGDATDLFGIFTPFLKLRTVGDLGDLRYNYVYYDLKAGVIDWDDVLKRAASGKIWKTLVEIFIRRHNPVIAGYEHPIKAIRQFALEVELSIIKERLKSYIDESVDEEINKKLLKLSRNFDENEFASIKDKLHKFAKLPDKTELKEKVLERINLLRRLKTVTSEVQASEKALSSILLEARTIRNWIEYVLNYGLLARITSARETAKKWQDILEVAVIYLKNNLGLRNEEIYGIYNEDIYKEGIYQEAERIIKKELNELQSGNLGDELKKYIFKSTIARIYKHLKENGFKRVKKLRATFTLDRVVLNFDIDGFGEGTLHSDFVRLRDAYTFAFKFSEVVKGKGEWHFNFQKGEMYFIYEKIEQKAG